VKKMVKVEETIDTIWTVGSEDEFKYIRRVKIVTIFGIKIFKKITVPIVLRKGKDGWENLYL
jgi:hypothetical protein